MSPKDYQVTGNVTGSGIGFELFRNMTVAGDFDAGPEKVLVKRLTKVMSGYQFLLAMVLGLYIGFSRLNQLRFIARVIRSNSALSCSTSSTTPISTLSQPITGPGTLEV